MEDTLNREVSGGMENMLNREVWRIWLIASYGGYAETGGMEDMLNREVWRIC
jgi:hypothetical protein